MTRPLMTDYYSLITSDRTGAISAIQIWGSNIRSIVKQLIRPKFKQANPQDEKMMLAYFLVEDNVIDEIVVRHIPASKSFTGEEVIELYPHGGRVTTKTIMDKLKSAGLFEMDQKDLPEYAQKNGKIDNIQKEAFEALFNIKTQYGTAIILSQALGKLSNSIKTIIEMINRRSEIALIMKNINSLLETAPLGLSITNQKKIVLLGNTNVGKSTIFNKLIGYERCITSPAVKTTRDAIADDILIEGISFTLVDTAGYIESAQSIDKKALAITHAVESEADLLLYVLDISEDIDTSTLVNIEKLKKLGAPMLCVCNKKDKGISDITLNEIFSLGVSHKITSAINNNGIDSLKSYILTKLDIKLLPSTEAVVFTQRQADILKDSRDKLTHRKDFKEAVRELWKLL